MTVKKPVSIVPGRDQIPIHCIFKELSRHEGGWGVGKVRVYGVYDAAGNMRYILRRGAYAKSPWCLYLPNPDGSEGEREIELPPTLRQEAAKDWVKKYLTREIE